MKKTMLSFAAIFASLYLFSQDHAGGGVSIDQIGANIAFAEAYDKEGKPLTNVNKQVFRSSVLNDNWGTGTVILKNGFVFKNVALQFDLYSNELHFKKNNIAYLFVDSLREFTMQFKDSLDDLTVTFSNGYPTIQKNTGATFYQVLASGAKLQLLNYKTKEVREKYEYLGPVRKEFQANDAYFIYDVTSGIIKSINLKKNGLLKALPQYASVINAFADKSKYNLKSEKEVIELFALLNH
jgi:hypothetical protein